MTFFELDHPKEEAAARLIGDVGRALQNALVERKVVGRISQREIADRLGVDRSSVNRMFSGYRNMTLESLAELCWAMDVQPHLILEQMLGDRSCNVPVAHLPRSSFPAVRTKENEAANQVQAVSNRVELSLPRVSINAS